MKNFLHIVLFAVLISCGGEQKKEKPVAVEEETPVAVPNFMPDSAWHFIKKQVDFGPRVPGTESHAATAQYLIHSLNQWGAAVYEQDFEAETWDGEKLPLKNIIAEFHPEKKKRILLAAHYDTRPYSDKDPELPNEPMIGANDGASGVGILLEIARNISQNPPPNVGVDIIFFDGEDWGERIDITQNIPPAPGFESWWCLGSQYWSRNKHKAGYGAYYGVLLDMVGAAGSEFHVEGVSSRFAPRIVDRVWDRAAKLGYSSIFVKEPQPEIIDDHVFVNRIAKIPMVNIVHYDPIDGYFGSYHHTQRDNMDLIDKRILEAVGETVQAVIYYEK